MPKIRQASICTFCITHNCTDRSTIHRQCDHFTPDTVIIANIPHGSTAKWAYGWAFTRDLVIARDHNKCIKCGRAVIAADIHHLHHRHAGGTDHPRNCVTICPQCHHAMGISLVEKRFQEQLEVTKNDQFWKQLTNR